MTNATLAAFACLIAFVTAISGYLILRRSFSDSAHSTPSLTPGQTRVWLELRPVEPAQSPVPVRSMAYGSRPPVPDAVQRTQDQMSGGWTH